LRTKVTYILSGIDKAMAFEWVAQNINQNEFELSFIILNQRDSYMHKWLISEGITSFFLHHRGKRDFPKNFLKMLQILRKLKPDIVHTHLFDANLIGLTAAKILGIKKRIYTRHHATFHHQYFPKAVKYDKWCNKIATHIVAISENVKNVLIDKELVPRDKVTLIHHGFDLEKFRNIPADEILSLRKIYGLNSKDYPVVGVIARYIKLKGHHYIIKAFTKVLDKYPNAKLVLANTNGPHKTEIQELLNKELKPEKFIEITFEPNLFVLYQLFDVYVHVPIDKQIEAFGQTYVEALAAGIPSVFTLSGVANEFVEHQKNALVVNYQDSQAISKSLIHLLGDKELSQQLTNNGMKSVEQFNLNLFIQKLEEIYREI